MSQSTSQNHKYSFSKIDPQAILGSTTGRPRDNLRATSGQPLNNLGPTFGQPRYIPRTTSGQPLDNLGTISGQPGITKWVVFQVLYKILSPRKFAQLLMPEIIFCQFWYTSVNNQDQQRVEMEWMKIVVTMTIDLIYGPQSKILDTYLVLD